MVPASLAVGRQRLAVRLATCGSATGSGLRCTRVRVERLARRRTRAAGDARHTVGPPVVSFTQRAGISEGSRAARSVYRASPVAGSVVIDKASPAIGRVVATEQKPATPHQFHFWTATETSIGIGAIVRVEEAGNGKGETGKVVYGVVTDGFAYSDLVTPLHDVVGAEGDPAKAADSPTVRQEIRLWTAAVLRQRPEEPLQPVPLGQVHVASDVDVAQALRMDTYLGGAPPTAIPVGLYTSGGLEAPVYVDADFLLGPEAAHLNISGVSGLATQTIAG